MEGVSSVGAEEQAVVASRRVAGPLTAATTGARVVVVAPEERSARLSLAAAHLILPTTRTANPVRAGLRRILAADGLGTISYVGVRALPLTIAPIRRARVVVAATDIAGIAAISAGIDVGPDLASVALEATRATHTVSVSADAPCTGISVGVGVLALVVVATHIGRAEVVVVAVGISVRAVAHENPPTAVTRSSALGSKVLASLGRSWAEDLPPTTIRNVRPAKPRRALGNANIGFGARIGRIALAALERLPIRVGKAAIPSVFVRNDGAVTLQVALSVWTTDLPPIAPARTHAGNRSAWCTGARR